MSNNIITLLAKYDRPAFIEQRRAMQKRLRSLPLTMMRMDPAELDSVRTSAETPKEVWQSRNFLAMIYADPMPDGSDVTRISVNRTTIDNEGRWTEGISWDELMAIKREVGRGDQWAVECFPPDRDVVNVANMRHLFLTDAPVFGWKRK